MRLAKGLRSLALNGLVLGLGLVLATGLLEVLLRIYNPFQARVKGDRIVLLANKEIQIENDIVPSLEKSITVRRNALGFRGPDPPADLDRRLSLVTVGGSTTQGFFMTEGKTWTALLEPPLALSFRDLWINNAGLDGHSTYGHVVLIEDQLVKLRPKVIVMLVGANDVAREPGEEWDAENVKGTLNFSSPAAFVKSLSPYSEVAALVANLYRSFQAYQQGLQHQYIDIAKQGYIDVPLEKEQAYVAQYSTPRYIDGFAERLRRSVSAARAAGIQIVLVTQPLLAGEGIDEVTRLDMARIQVGPERNGRMWWQLLERYNDVTRQVAQQENVPLIELARQMPKSSRYYYDFLHFNNAGSEKVAEIVAAGLCPVLAELFPDFQTAPCGEPRSSSAAP